MKHTNTRRGFTQTVKDVIICPPCGEQSLAPEGLNPGVAGATKEGQNRKITLWPLLPRLTAVLPPQGREMSCGFTLIELLVVVLIIGILAAVAVPQYQKAVLKSRLAQLDVIFNTAQKAIDMYLLENGWPASGTVSLTGKNRVSTIEMPGNCDMDTLSCYTPVGSLKVSCSSSSCSLEIQTDYKEDGTIGNKALGGAGMLMMTITPNQKYVSLAQPKGPCLWVASHPDIPVSGMMARAICSSLGVTLPNPQK